MTTRSRQKKRTPRPQGVAAAPAAAAAASAASSPAPADAAAVAEVVDVIEASEAETVGDASIPEAVRAASPEGEGDATGGGGLPPRPVGGGRGLDSHAARLIATLVVFAVVLVGAAVAGFRQTDIEGSTKSATYEATLEYDRQVEQEGDLLAFALDPLLSLRGVEIVKLETMPGSQAVIQEATLRLPLGPTYTSDAYAAKWRGRGLEARRMGERDRYQVLAANRNNRIVINATFAPDPERPSRTLASVMLHRSPTPEERRWYEYPSDLPYPPKGSQTTGQAGGNAASHRGRTWMVQSPVSVDALHDHYLYGLRHAGWNIVSGGTARTNRGALVHRYTVTRGAAGYTLQISAMPNPGRFTSTAVIASF